MITEPFQYIIGIPVFILFVIIPIINLIITYMAHKSIFTKKFNLKNENNNDINTVEKLYNISNPYCADFKMHDEKVTCLRDNYYKIEKELLKYKLLYDNVRAEIHNVSEINTSLCNKIRQLEIASISVKVLDNDMMKVLNDTTIKIGKATPTKDRTSEKICIWTDAGNSWQTSCEHKKKPYTATFKHKYCQNCGGKIVEKQ